MKKFNIYITLCLSVLLGITSCKKIDTVRPYDAIQVKDAFKTVSDAAQWDIGVYSTFRNNYGEEQNGTDIQSDQLNATLDFGNRNGSEHRWGTFFLSDDYLIRDVWSGYYAAIANINVAIDGFKTIKPANANETAELNQYTGDLYLARAYYYHRLILRWAKPYEPASAANDPGVPLIITYNLFQNPPRATVKQVYDQILSDITTAEGLLANVEGSQGAQTFTIDAATALEARVKLHTQDWAGAYNAANKLITSGTYPLIKDLAAFQDYWANDGTVESIFQIYYSPSQLPTNYYDNYLSFNTSTGNYDPDFVPLKSVLDLYVNSDIRKATYFTTQTATIQGVDYTLDLVNKYPGNPAFFSGTISNYYNEPKVFRIAEFYLIAAEAAANNSDPEHALLALNTLRKNRGISDVNASGTSLRDSIRTERFRELSFEGFRLDDLKRWHLGFNRTGKAQNVDALQGGIGFYTLNISPDDNKFVWGLPSNDITVNPNLKPQNPGW